MARKFEKLVIIAGKKLTQEMLDLTARELGPGRCLGARLIGMRFCDEGGYLALKFEESKGSHPKFKISQTVPRGFEGEVYELKNLSRFSAELAELVPDEKIIIWYK